MKLTDEELRRFAELAASAEAPRPPETPQSFAELVAERRGGLARRG